MEPTRERWYTRVGRYTWRTLDWSRRLVFGFIALVLLISLFIGIVAPSGADVSGSTILVVRPEGPIVEQLAGDPFDRALASARGDDAKEMLLWDVVDAVRAAKDDERVKAVFLDLREMGATRLPALEEVARALQEVKDSGKPVIAAADYYSAGPYYLAAHASEVFLHELGIVLLEGMGRFRTYYRDGLDRLEVEMNVIRVGEYKSAVEPFLRDDMSPEDRRASEEWLGDLWRSYLSAVAGARRLEPQALTAYIENANATLRAAGGDAAKVALDAKLVDRLGSREDVRARLIALAGEDEDTHSYHEIELRDYLKALGKDRTDTGSASKVVAVIVAKGEIEDGKKAPGTIGGDSTAALILEARKDDKVKAIVLRVDSPGGSAHASELIREELELARAAGKPVVVSMGGLAASGGYWISSSSDEIWASPSTITGSIGIFGMLPTVEKPLAKHLGMRVDGVGTTWITDGYRPDRALDPRVKELVRQLVERGYREFLTRVAEARDKTTEQVDQIARGRVWSGADAKDIGLVDGLGGFAQAVAAAAKRAQLGDDYRVRFVEKERGWQDRVIASMLATVVRATGAAYARSASQRLLEELVAPLARLRAVAPQGGVYAYCLDCAYE